MIETAAFVAVILQRDLGIAVQPAPRVFGLLENYVLRFRKS